MPLLRFVWDKAQRDSSLDVLKLLLKENEMSSSLLAGVSGLRSYQLMLEVVGNNLANMNTTAYKASTVQFSDMLSQTISMGTEATVAVGGTNPIQKGLGVQTSAITRDFAQGSLSTTGRLFDLGIQGAGFFVTTDGAESYYTRAGTFDVDANSDLVEIATGRKVLGSENQTINIPLNSNTPGKETDFVVMNGNLSSKAEAPLAQIMQTNLEFTDFTNPLVPIPATGTTDLNNLSDPPGTWVGDGTEKIEITGVDYDGTVVNEVFTYGAANDGTTFGDLVTFIDTAFPGATASLDADGHMSLTSDTVGITSLELGLAVETSTSDHIDFLDHSFKAVQVGRDAEEVSTSIVIYDSQAAAHTLSFVFAKTSENEWEMKASVNPEEGLVDPSFGRDTISNITFDSNGVLDNTFNGQIYIDFNGIKEPQIVNVIFAEDRENPTAGLTQYGATQSNAVAEEQDGYAAGTLSTVSIQKDGTLRGIYTNGVITEIAVLRIVTFSNPGGLRATGENMYQPGPNSGNPIPGRAMTGSAGSIVSGALENGNVDVALEFTKMITAQRGFQVNARTITATDQMLQEVANLVR